MNRISVQTPARSDAGSTTPPRSSVATPTESYTPSELEQEIVREGAKAVRAARGQVTGQTMAEIRDSLVSVLRSDTFARFRELVDQQSRVEADLSKLSIRSVTLGVEVAVALIIGAQGSLGVGVPPGQWDNFDEYVIYLSAAGEIGVVEGAIGGIVLGLYNVQPTGLSGGSYGFSLEFGFVEEVEVEGSFQHADGTGFMGIAVTEAGGEDDGVDGLYSYTWIWNWDTPHVYQTPKSNYMLLSSIQCNQQSENDGHDEVYFTFTPDNGTTYRYPTHGQYSMANDDQYDMWYPNRSIWFDDQVTVQLWDHDDGTDDDSLGSHTYSVNGFQSSVQVTGSSGKYTLGASLNPGPAPFLPPKHINTADMSKNGPGVCEFNGNFYIVWRGNTNDNIYFSSSSNGEAWPYGARINTTDTTSGRPSATAFNGQLFVFFQGTNNGVFWTAGDGVDSFLGARMVAGAYTSTPPAPCVFNGVLYLFWTTNDTASRIVWSRFDPSTSSWSPQQYINGVDNTAMGVAACVFNDQMYLFWRGGGSDLAMYVTSSSSTSFPPGVNVRNGEVTPFTPGACVYEGRVYLIFISNDSSWAVRTMSSSDGRSFSPSALAGADVSELPATGLAFANALRLCFTNTQSQLVTSQSTF
jgi:hypothetical protein